MKLRNLLVQFVNALIPLHVRDCPVLDVHYYNTRGRDALRPAQHRLRAFEVLPSEVGTKLINKLPLDLQAENGQPLFKMKLRNLLVQGAFYSVGEFMDRGC
ncbi:hypothetical protein J6590_058992 [Homalodisca vitripennis]|nr:hypothetical protein J6590_058992 [Homalodisca vitripennis]